MKGLSVDDCVNKAEEFISKNGSCLLLFDVVGSRNYNPKNVQHLVDELYLMMTDLNKKFCDYFPENYLATLTRKEKGFECLLGDGSWAGINSSETIPEIIRYQKEKYPHINLYWGVAENGFDEEGVKVVK